MKAKIINDAKHQKEILRQIKKEVSEMKSTLCKVPGIVFIVLSGQINLIKNSVLLHETMAKNLK